MFNKTKEKRNEQQEQYDLELQLERERLLMLSEKELLVELLMKMDKISNQLDHVDTSIRVYNN